MIKTSPRYVKKVDKNNVSFERSSLDIYSIMFLFCFVNFVRQDWGISSNSRAPALHVGGTGIDAQILHTFFSFFSSSSQICLQLRRDNQKLDNITAALLNTSHETLLINSFKAEGRGPKHTNYVLGNNVLLIVSTKMYF